MGFQTDFTILNDAAGEIKRNPLEFAEKMYNAMIGHYHSKDYVSNGHFHNDTISMGIGNHCNPIVVNHYHHADDHRILISGGNNLFNVGTYSKQYVRMAERFPDILDDHIRMLDDEVKALKKLRKDLKAKVSV
jgi:hypothetical protein